MFLVLKKSVLGVYGTGNSATIEVTAQLEYFCDLLSILFDLYNALCPFLADFYKLAIRELVEFSMHTCCNPIFISEIQSFQK